jgi:hypothetical protein
VRPSTRRSNVVEIALVLTWAKHTNLIGGLFDTVVHGLLHI